MDDLKKRIDLINQKTEALRTEAQKIAEELHKSGVKFESLKIGVFQFWVDNGEVCSEPPIPF